MHTEFAHVTGACMVVVVDVDCCIIVWSDVDGVLDGPKGLCWAGAREVVLAVWRYKKIRCDRASGAGGDGNKKKMDHFSHQNLKLCHLLGHFSFFSCFSFWFLVIIWVC